MNSQEEFDSFCEKLKQLFVEYDVCIWADYGRELYLSRLSTNGLSLEHMVDFYCDESINLVAHLK